MADNNMYGINWKERAVRAFNSQKSSAKAASSKNKSNGTLDNRAAYDLENVSFENVSDFDMMERLFRYKNEVGERILPYITASSSGIAEITHPLRTFKCNTQILIEKMKGLERTFRDLDSPLQKIASINEKGVEEMMLNEKYENKDQEIINKDKISESVQEISLISITDIQEYQKHSEKCFDTGIIKEYDEYETEADYGAEAECAAELDRSIDKIPDIVFTGCMSKTISSIMKLFRLETKHKNETGINKKQKIEECNGSRLKVFKMSSPVNSSQNGQNIWSIKDTNKEDTHKNDSSETINKYKIKSQEDKNKNGQSMWLKEDIPKWDLKENETDAIKKYRNSKDLHGVIKMPDRPRSFGVDTGERDQGCRAPDLILEEFRRQMIQKLRRNEYKLNNPRASDLMLELSIDKAKKRADKKEKLSEIISENNYAGGMGNMSGMVSLEQFKLIGNQITESIIDAFVSIKDGNLKEAQMKVSLLKELLEIAERTVELSNKVSEMTELDRSIEQTEEYEEDSGSNVISLKELKHRRKSEIIDYDEGGGGGGRIEDHAGMAAPDRKEKYYEFNLKNNINKERIRLRNGADNKKIKTLQKASGKAKRFNSSVLAKKLAGSGLSPLFRKVCQEDSILKACCKSISGAGRIRYYDKKLSIERKLFIRPALMFECDIGSPGFRALNLKYKIYNQKSGIIERQELRNKAETLTKLNLKASLKYELKQSAVNEEKRKYKTFLFPRGPTKRHETKEKPCGFSLKINKGTYYQKKLNNKSLLWEI